MRKYRFCEALLRCAIPLLLALVLLVPQTAGAAVFRCSLFTISMPPGWELINGPFKKAGGEMAVLGRRDHKASIQMMYGPADPSHFRSIVEGYARSMHGTPPVYRGNQASFDCEARKAGQKLHIVFRHDDTATKLVIFIFNGNLSEMQFVSQGMTTPHPGLVPDLSPAPAPRMQPQSSGSRGRQRSSSRP